MNKQSIKNSIKIAIFGISLTALSGVASAQYLPNAGGNYIPVTNGAVVSQTVSYNDNSNYYNNNQIEYYNNPVLTGYGNGSVVSNTYQNNNQNYYVPQNNSNIFALGNNYGPTVSSNGTSNGSQNQNNTGLSVDTYSATNTGISGSTLSGGFTIANPHTNTSVWFEYGESSSTLNQKTVTQIFSTTSGSFSKLVYGLKPNTTYFYRAVAQHGGEVVKGDIVTLKTSKIISSTGGGSSNTNSSGNNNDGEVLGDNETIQEEEMNRSNLGALAFWSGFFPDSALGWIILIIIILIIILLARRYREKKAHGAHH